MLPQESFNHSQVLSYPYYLDLQQITCNQCWGGLAWEQTQRQRKAVWQGLVLTETLQPEAGIQPWKDEKSNGDYGFAGEIHIININLAW